MCLYIVYLFIWLCQVLVSGLGCLATCGILVPQLGIKPLPPALQGRFLTTGPPGKLLDFIYFFMCHNCSFVFMYFPFQFFIFHSFLQWYFCLRYFPSVYRQILCSTLFQILFFLARCRFLNWLFFFIVSFLSAPPSRHSTVF